MGSRLNNLAIKGFAVLLVVRALSNFRKPFADTVGFVFFGIVLKGIPNLILSPLFGIYMLATAWAIWTRHRLAVPLTFGYAAYVLISIPLYNVFNSPERTPGFILITILMIGLPWGVLWLLQRERSAA